MNDNRDILVKCRQQAAVCREQGFPETADFLTELADEIDALRHRLKIRVMDTASSVVLDKVNGHG
jgi:hypothetical protein